MKVLILHLSDIHIAANDDPVLGRATLLADAVKNADYELALCVIVVTGDVAYSGAEEEYEAADGFLRSLTERLGIAWGGKVPIKQVVIPGNHDCDFRTDLPARDALLEALTKEEHPSKDGQQTCTEVQESFFTFRDSLAAAELRSHSQLFYEYRFEVGSVSVLCRCLNTAWASKMREVQGTLRFPPELIEAPEAADVVITLLHHPYNWLEANNARALRTRLEETSDIILTGHEHDFQLRFVKGNRGERSLYIEGSPLQAEDDPERSEFNVLLLDVEARRQRALHLEWNGGRYTPSLPPSAWEEYHVNRLRRAGRHEVSEEFISELLDPGVVLTHPCGKRLTLEDIFVYPDLREVVVPPTGPGELLSARCLVEFLLAERRLLVISGPEKSGRTCLAKTLFRDFHKSGYVPLLARGDELRVTDDDRIYDTLEELYEGQYSRPPRADFHQLDTARRVLIVDDVHKLRLGKKSLSSILRRFQRFAGTVVLLTDEIAQALAEVLGLGVDGGDSVLHYRLQPFGYVRRNELAERWYALDPAAAGDEGLFARRLVDAKEMMATAIGRNFVPSYPIFILPLLQTQQHAEAVDVHASTYGYFYELLIKRALAAGSSKEAYDVKLAYLAFLAYEIYEHGASDGITEQELRRIHGEYERIYMVPVSFAGILADLLACSVLKEHGGRYSFKYTYYYYYFVAARLRDGITEERYQTAIRALCDRLHEEESANILLFLAHLSKHPFIVEQMLRRAGEVYADLEPLALKPEDSPIRDVDRALKGIVYEEQELRESRRAMLQELDAAAAQATKEEDARIANENIARFGLSLRTLQILGQIIKNFPGSIEGALKMRVTKECYNLGLRALRFFFKEVDAEKEDLARQVVEAIRQTKPDAPQEALVKGARRSMEGLVFLGTYGMIQRIAAAVGSPHLTQVYNQLLEESPTDSVRLVHHSILLDQADRFPEASLIALGKELRDNDLATYVLRGLIVNHFHLFSVGYDVKQRICEKLGIAYKRLQARDVTRLLSK